MVKQFFPNEPYYLAVMGSPIRHSLSPEIFHWLSQKQKKWVTYRKIEVLPQQLKLTLSLLRDVHLLNGWNVTLPHKEAIASHLDQLSPEAECIGAVNLIHKKNNKLIGYNTDYQGVLRSLLEKKRNWKSAQAVIYGAGGAAIAAGYALGKLGLSQVVYVNRNRERAAKVARRLRKYFPNTIYTYLSLKKDTRQWNEVQLFINATPVGMDGFPSTHFLPELLPPEALVFDMVYFPSKTPFLKHAMRQDLKTVNGIDMLVWQAIAGWEIWFGKLHQVKRLKLELKNYLEKRLKLVE